VPEAKGPVGDCDQGTPGDGVGDPHEDIGDQPANLGTSHALATYPDDRGQGDSAQGHQGMEVGIQGHDDAPILAGSINDLAVVGSAQSDVGDMSGLDTEVLQMRHGAAG
jgi:hypothetical protein